MSLVCVAYVAIKCDPIMPRNMCNVGMSACRDVVLPFKMLTGLQWFLESRVRRWAGAWIVFRSAAPDAKHLQLQQQADPVIRSH